MLIALGSGFLCSCGGAAQTKPEDGAAAAPPRASPSGPPAVMTTIQTPCVAGSGRDYAVGPGAGQIPELDQVPWESLGAGDTVRVHHRATPYRGKFLITNGGSETSPLRICGVPGPNGARPVIDGANAVTRTSLSYGDAYAGPIHQARSIVTIKGSPLAYTAYPQHIRIDGLTIRGANPANTFTDTAGAVQRYSDFGACIWIDRGAHITLADLEVTDCTNGIFSKSTDDGDFAVTRDIRLVGSHIHGNGLAGNDRLHGVYLQSVGVIYEFNVFGPSRPGAIGNAIKDRSVGSVVRYNRIEEGAHAIDLVEAEDFPATATADPAYRSAYVYGNQIVKRGNTGSVIHYGGDHYTSTPGATWGEPIFRKGTLYFFNNTVRVTGTEGVLFNVSTTEEKAEVWNNVFYFDPGVQFPSMRQSSDVGGQWVAGGIVNLGRNWINANWDDSDPYHQIPGQLNGRANMLTGTTAPIDVQTLVPAAGSAIIDASQPGPQAAQAWKVEYEQGATGLPVVRTVGGAALDLGAREAR